ncbi:hypothetical protein N7457_007498 [Penicillium paradoxum]|uniref:uncharacterized protein n=1 Tax=Penicillium paradoxum TaxID=176176 RepID=UPI0025469D0B|nr:uncharacterized protein N7457_007498 [Penicillium paradoxum]KAJ5779778.1 hypothetical protein N7457_007498 [Penicillium paradoxum]
MLKRGALGPHGSKEDEGNFGMASTPDEKPQRATAAQLANRKIKDVRRRRAPTPSGGASDAAPFNPFSSATPAAAPAPAPIQSSGFVFGQNQSQSFPGASSTPTQGGMFSSGTNGQAAEPAPFSFGATSTSFGSAPSSNPFSVDTSFGGSSQSTNGFSFGGFNAGSQATPSFGGFGAQQNASTPATTSATTSASGGLFGKTTTNISPADEIMSVSPDTKPNGGSVFAQQPAPGGLALGNPFSNLSGQNASNPFAPPKAAGTDQTAAKPAEPQPFKPLFGATPAASKPFGGEKEQPAASNPFAFSSGQNTTTSNNLFAPRAPSADPISAKPVEAAQPFGALFGSKSSSQPPESVSNLFAPKPAAEEPKASNPFANLSAPSSFSGLSSPKVTGTEESSGKTAEAQPFKTMFGTPAPSKVSEFGKEQSATPAFGNMFATPKPTSENATAKATEDQPFKSMFGTPAASKTSETKETATPAFGNMFATPKPAAEIAPAKPTGDQPFKSMFGTPAASKTLEAVTESPATPAFGNMFATPTPAVDSAAAKPLGNQLPKPMFGTPASSKPAVAEKEQSAASGVFAPKATSEEQTPLPAKNVQFGSIFGASPATSKLGEGQTAQATPSNPFANLSGQNAFNNPFALKPAEQAEKPQSPGKPLFGASVGVEDNKNNNQAALGTALANPFAATPKATNEPPKEAATATTIQAPSSQLSSDASQKSCLQFPSTSSSPLPSSSSTSTVSNISTTSSTLLASSTFIAPDTDSLFPKPDHPVSIEYPDMPLKRLFPEDAEVDRRHLNEATLLWKLRMLTESFKREVAKCDPMTDDIDDVILLYVELRRDMGIPIGSIDPIEEAERAELNHREAAQEAPNGEVPAPIATPPTFTPPNLHGKRTAPADKPESGSSTSSKFAQSFSAPSPAPATTAADAFSAPVAAKIPAATGPVSAAAPVATSAATPAAAIPKFDGGATSTAIPKFGAGAASTAAPNFQIPKFGAGATGTDFMAQFKAQADKTAAEEKAKRKAEEFDSDSDDEEEWERKDAERQREKKAQHEAAAKKRPIFVPGEGFKFVDDTTPQSVAGPTTPATTATPVTTSTPAPFASLAAPLSSSALGASTSSVSRIPSTPDASESSSILGTNQPSPASAAFGGAKPASSTSIFGTGLASSTNSSVFASSQPVPASQNIFGGLKPTSPKRKASADDSDDEDDAPAKRVKSTSPPPSGASIFGRVSTATTPVAPTPSFPAASTTPFTPAAQASPFSQPVSATPSAPAAEPKVANDDEEGEPGEIFDLTRGNGGEEEETVLFEDKSRAFKLDGQWASKGTGPVRLLQHPVTKRARIVARADPSGNVILNTLLKKEFDYSLTTNSVQFMVPEEDGKLRHWALRVKRERLQEFHDLIQKIKN